MSTKALSSTGILDGLFIRTRRRYGAARLAWIRTASFAAINGSLPYLVTHPEREIAEARGVTWRCEACRETVGYSSLSGSRGRMIAKTIRGAHRHNAERHPRRWARSQNFSGPVALDEARRVTRWGADA